MINPTTFARLERAVVTALGRAPTAVQRVIAGGPPTADGIPIEPEVGAAPPALVGPRRHVRGPAAC